MARPRKQTTEASATDSFESINSGDPFQKRLAQMAKLREKYPNARTSTGATEDENPVWVMVPDLGKQWALGRIGYACGRIKYILGTEGSSKTSNLLYDCNLAIEQGGLATIVEWENAMDASHIAKYVKQPDKLMIIHADCLEEGMEISRQVLNDYEEIDPDGNLPKVLGADSIGGSVMRRALDEKVELGDNRVGGPGLYMSSAIPYLNNMCARTKTLWVIIGQAREEIPTGFSGPPKPLIERVTGKGGKAVPFHSTYWEFLQRRGTLKNDSGKTGFTVESTFKKNKKGVQWRNYYYDVSFAPGENIVFSDHTMNLLATGNIGGVKVQRNRFWCEEIGIPESSKLYPDEMYQLVHSEQHIGHFRQALGIRTDARSEVIATQGDRQSTSDDELLAAEAAGEE